MGQARYSRVTRFSGIPSIPDEKQRLFPRRDMLNRHVSGAVTKGRFMRSEIRGYEAGGMDVGESLQADLPRVAIRPAALSRSSRMAILAVVGGAN